MHGSKLRTGDVRCLNSECCQANSYAYSDLCIGSNVEIPFLFAAQDQHPDITFHAVAAGRGEREQLARVAESKELDELICRPVDSGHWLQVTANTGFFVNGMMNHVTGFWSPKSNEIETVRVFVDHVLPRILTRFGRFIVHASCVAYDDRAIIFLGDSGRGKSTLALAHCKMLGAELVSDDCVELNFESDRLIAKSTYRAHRVWSDSNDVLNQHYECATMVDSDEGKVKLVPPSAARRSYHVVAAYLLAEANREIVVEILSRKAGVMGIMNQVFHFRGMPSRTELGETFDRCEKVFDIVGCRSLQFPRNYELLKSVVDLTKK